MPSSLVEFVHAGIRSIHTSLRFLCTEFGSRLQFQNELDGALDVHAGRLAWLTPKPDSVYLKENDPLPHIIGKTAETRRNNSRTMRTFSKGRLYLQRAVMAR
jgi:hypothetical protein